MKDIFDLMGKEKKEVIIEFEEHLNNEGEWGPSGSSSDDFDECILICEDKKYKYYLCSNDYYKINDTIIYRRKI